MNLLVGTRIGVYRTDPGRVDDAVRVLDSDRVLRVRRFGARAYASTRSGLYRSIDSGRSWTRLASPRKEIYSICEQPIGKRLFVGTYPARVYASGDGGATWTACDGLQKLPSRPEWHTPPRHRDGAYVRSLASAGDDRLVAGIEVGGVHRSDDGGRTWTERHDGVHDDVHHVLVRSDAHWIASTGDGLYRTRDAGRSWTRLDADLDRRYFREAFVRDERLYAAAADGPPSTWRGPRGTDAALYESPDGGETFESVEYPGSPHEFVLSWTAVDGDVYAGTTAGQILRREATGWLGVGSVPSEATSMVAVER